MAESNIEILDRVINRDYPKCDVLYSWQALKKELRGSGQNSAELKKQIKEAVLKHDDTSLKEMEANIDNIFNSLPGGETNKQSEPCCQAAKQIIEWYGILHQACPVCNRLL